MKNIKRLSRALLKNKVNHFIFGFVFLVVIALICQNLFAADEADTTDKTKKNSYAGSQKCGECHEKEYKGWRNTLHSKIVQNAKQNPAVILGDFNVPEVKELLEKYKTIEYTVGSHWKQRYVVKIDGEDYALPIVWDVVTKSWDNYSNANWNRMPYSKFCIGCHTINYNPVDKSYTEHDVGCEACHGPGGNHIQADGDAKLIINPSKLSEKLHDMLCAACHVKIGKDKSQKYTFPIGFRPGENLIDYLFVINKTAEETDEEAILNAFAEWKKNKKAPKECDRCGIKRPGVPRLHNLDETDADACLECHNFKDEEKLSLHTHHAKEISITCSDCHKARKEQEKKEERNIHSYDFYLIHESGCYDPFIEKYCVDCHKDKTKEWATQFVIDWAVPQDFIHSESQE